MRFEHLLEINDPNLPFLEALSRNQVWSGLMHRVEDSRNFLPGLDECVILSRTEGMVERCLRWGQVEVRDRVSFAVEEWVRFETLPSEHHGGGLLTVRIEEPEEGRLFLRCIYETVFTLGQEAEDEGYADYIKQAYESADKDMLLRIRELAASVRLN
ncbi:MAG TPA: AtaL-like protein [Rhodocyclaceae bacterium]|nr:AtaL-like protein [Rhodocyclaceae bacterium]